jgi:hypothetical protein
MAKVNGKYMLELYPSDWNTIVSEFNSNRQVGRDTVLERCIAGEPVKCIVTGYAWNEMKKPNSPLKQKIFVQITEVISTNS